GKIELGDYSGPVEAKYSISPLKGIQDYIRQNNLDIEVISRDAGNTERRTDFFTLSGFATVSRDGSVREYDATKFDDSSKGLIVSSSFGQTAIRGIKSGDWTAYHNVDITGVDSIRFNMNVMVNGGTLEVRV